MSGAIIAAVAALIVGVLGALLSYTNARRLSRKEAQLVRVNAQLSELYGPMHATLEATRIAYETFVRKSRDSPNFFNPRLPAPTDDQLTLWRTWVTTVLQPGNKRTYELIVNKAHLLIDDEMPQCLLSFCAHVAGFDVTIKRWEAGDYTSHLSVVSHPREALNSYARESFRQLKTTQARLLAESKTSPSAGKHPSLGRQ